MQRYRASTTFRLSTRILFLGISIIFCFSLIFIWIYPKIKNGLYETRYAATRNLVETGWNVIDYYVLAEAEGRLDSQTARSEALNAVKKLSYGDSGYFWINDMHPTMVMHPHKPQLDGTDLSENKDPNGKKLFVEFVRVCREKGEGFVDYYWPKPGKDEPVPKISFVKRVPKWDWIIGSGIYLDDLEDAVAAMVFRIYSGVILISIGAFLISLYMAKSISSPVKNIVDELNDGAVQISAASAQIASTSQTMAKGVSEQASSLQITSSSLDEISRVSSRNSENALKADSVMKEAERAVENVSDMLDRLADSMHNISSSSDETFRIIKSIDEIAFQTNLLALNAAVEAARAGEAGKGFAVVAEEVRNLAGRASDAARSTAELIDQTVAGIKNGSGSVSELRENFSSVTESTERVSEIISDIANSSTSQARNIEQINSILAGMNSSIQETAAGYEETASSAEELNSQADQIRFSMMDLSRVISGKQHNGSTASAPYSNRLPLTAETFVGETG